MTEVVPRDDDSLVFEKTAKRMQETLRYFLCVRGGGDNLFQGRRRK